MPVMERTAITLPPKARKLTEDTVSTIRKSKAISAVKRMQETSAIRGNDKMTLDEINAIIADVRGNSKK